MYIVTLNMLFFFTAFVRDVVTNDRYTVFRSRRVDYIYAPRVTATATAPRPDGASPGPVHHADDVICDCDDNVDERCRCDGDGKIRIKITCQRRRRHGGRQAVVRRFVGDSAAPSGSRLQRLTTA